MPKSIPSNLPPQSPIARLASDTLETLIEVRSVEYKQSEPFGTLKVHIIKTAIAMSNLRDGGLLIVGVERRAAGLHRTGISSADLTTYDADSVLAAINTYATPAVDAIVATMEHKGVKYLVMYVQEFSSTPVICAKDSAWGNAGTIFIRPRGFIETRPPRTGPELDELLELAAEKRALKMIRQRDTLNTAASSGTLPSKADDDRYDTETKELHGL